MYLDAARNIFKTINGLEEIERTKTKLKGHSKTAITIKKNILLTSKPFRSLFS